MAKEVIRPFASLNVVVAGLPSQGTAPEQDDERLITEQPFAPDDVGRRVDDHEGGLPAASLLVPLDAVTEEVEALVEGLEERLVVEELVDLGQVAGQGS